MADTARQAAARGGRATAPGKAPSKTPAPVQARSFRQNPVQRDAETDAGGDWTSFDKRPLQLRQAASAEADVTAATAESATEGSGGEVPFKQEMEAGFGQDFSSVRSHTSDAAKSANESFGSTAFATGEDVAFRSSSPDKFTVAHELAHVVQQREGRVSTPQGKGGVINNDPSLESEADHAATEVVAGRAAPGIKDHPEGPSFSESPVQRRAQPGAIQRKAAGPVQLTSETEKARDEQVAELEKDASGLAADLKAIGLGTGKFKTSADKFEQIADALTGQGASGVKAIADQIYQAPTYPDSMVALTADLNKFNDGTDRGKARERYLLHLTGAGQPDNLDRLAISLALASHSAASTWWPGKPGDPVEVARMFEGDGPEWSAAEIAEVRDASKPYKKAIDNLGDGKTRIWAAVDRYGAKQNVMAAAEEKKNVDANVASTQVDKDAAQNKVDTASLALCVAADKHLASIIRQMENTFTKFGKAKKKKSFEEINAWAGKATNQERMYVVRTNSEFRKACVSAMHELDAKLADHLLLGHVPSAFIDEVLAKNSADHDTTKLQDASAKKKDLEGTGAGPADQEGTQAVLSSAYTLIKALDREIAKKEAKTLGAETSAYERTWFIDSVESMSDKERDAFIKYYAVAAGAALNAWDEPARLKTIKYIHDTVLKGQAGFSSAAASKVERRLRVTGVIGETFKVMREYPKAKDSAEGRLEWLCGKLSMTGADDVAQIRADTSVFDLVVADIKAALPGKGKTWAVRASEMMGVAFPDNSGNIDPAAVDANKQKEAKAGATEGSQQPGFWAQRLRFELDRWFGGKDWGDIASLIHRAGMAGDSAVAAKKAADPNIDAAAEKTNWLASVFTELGDLQGKLKGETTGLSGSTWANFFIPPIIEPTAEWRIKVSTRGIANRSSEITTVIEDMSGAALLNQMSNFPQYKALWAAFDEAQASGDVAKTTAAANDVNKFVIDVKPEILAVIEKEHNNFFGGRGSTTVSVVGSIRKKLADALATDAEAQALFLSSGARLGDIDGMRARMKVIFAMDEESLSKKGVQWDAINVKGLERREAMWQLKGAHREMQALNKVSNTTNDGAMKDAAGTEMSHEARTAKLDEQAQQKEEATKKVDTKAEDYSRRKAAFEEMRATYNGRVMMVINLILAAAVTAAVSFATAGVGSPFLVALIAWGFGIVKAVTAAAIEAALAGNLDVSMDAVARATIAKLVELGVAMATTAVGEAVKSAWEGVAGTDWADKVDEARKTGEAVDPLEKSIKPIEAYEKAEIWLEASKDAGVGLVNQSITKVGEGITTVATEDRPLEKLKEGASLKGAVLGGLKTAATGFVVSLGKQGWEKVFAKKDQEKLDKSQEKRDEAHDGLQAGDKDKIDTSGADVEAAKKTLGEKDISLTQAQNNHAETTRLLGVKDQDIATTQGNLSALEQRWASDGHGGLTDQQFNAQRGELTSQLGALQGQRTELAGIQGQQQGVMDTALAEKNSASVDLTAKQGVDNRLGALKTSNTKMVDAAQQLADTKRYGVEVPGTVIEEGTGTGVGKLEEALTPDKMEASERRTDKEDAAIDPAQQQADSQQRKSAYALADNLKALLGASQALGVGGLNDKQAAATKAINLLKRRGDDVELAYKAYQRDPNSNAQARYKMAVEQLNAELGPGKESFKTFGEAIAKAVDTKAGAGVGAEVAPYRRLKEAVHPLSSATGLLKSFTDEVGKLTLPLLNLVTQGEELRDVEKAISDTATSLTSGDPADPGLAARVGDLKAKVDRRAALVAQGLDGLKANITTGLGNVQALTSDNNKVFENYMIKQATRLRADYAKVLLEVTKAVKGLSPTMGDDKLAAMKDALKRLGAAANPVRRL